jgi:hypothetical protein
MKKGDDVADNDDDTVRAGVSQDRETATLFTEESFLSVRYHDDGSKELNAFNRFFLHMVYL